MSVNIDNKSKYNFNFSIIQIILSQNLHVSRV